MRAEIRSWPAEHTVLAAFGSVAVLSSRFLGLIDTRVLAGLWTGILLLGLAETPARQPSRPRHRRAATRAHPEPKVFRVSRCAS